jgi:hypothetical protein
VPPKNNEPPKSLQAWSPNQIRGLIPAPTLTAWSASDAATEAAYRPFNLKIAAMSRDSLASSALLLNSLASVRSSPWVLRSKQFSASFVHLSANC